MKRIAIVEDNRNFAEEVKKEINASEWEHSVEIDIYENPINFLDNMKNGRRYDLCLSDIEMPEMNGIELAREIRRSDPYMLLIFLTAYPKYAILGYKVEAYDYILKTHFKAEWSRVLTKIQREFKKEDNEFYFVETPNIYEKIPLSHILYIYKEKKYTVFVQADRTTSVRKTLKQVRQELESKDQFILVERGYIANIEKIKRFEARELEMENGKIIPIGHIRSAEIRDKIHLYYRDRF